MALKNLDSISLEELVGTLMVDEQELQQDEGLNKKKSLALNIQKTQKASSSKESYSKSTFGGLSRALRVDNSSSNEEFEDKSHEDELAFISQKIHKIWKNKSRSK